MASTIVLETATAGSRAQTLVIFVANHTFEAGSADGNAFVEDCKECIVTGRYDSFIRIVLERRKEIFAAASEQDIEGVFSLIFSFIRSVDASKVTDTIDFIYEALAENALDKPTLRLQILTNLYNLLDNEMDLRLFVFKKLVAFAAMAGKMELVKPYFAGADGWREKWGLSEAQWRDICLSLATELEAAGDGETAQTFRLKYLHSFDAVEDASGLVEAEEVAVAAAVGFIAAPLTSYSVNLVDIPAVQAALKTSAKHADLFQLLQLFTSADLAGFKVFAGEKAGSLAAYGIDTEACFGTLRLLSLCALAVHNPVMTFSQIAEALEVAESEVESWVVTAMGKGLLTGRIDQLARTVTPTGVTRRQFAEGEWGELLEKLTAWEGRVGGILGVVRQARAGEV
jgi:translation initiation factor 3 subunit M